MSTSFSCHGQCLCGAVQLDCRLDTTKVSACHCRTCRRWGGGPLLAVECAEPPAISGREVLGIHPSSTWAERGFCTQCGTHLCYRLRARPHYAIPVGLLEGADWLLDSEVFIEEQPAWYCFAHSRRQLTGAEALAEHDSRGPLPRFDSGRRHDCWSPDPERLRARRLARRGSCQSLSLAYP